jgi:putative oxidoreductase
MMLLEAIARSFAHWEWLGQLLARESVGLLFVLSGRGKLFVPSRREQMRETIRQAGLPRPDLSAAAISAVELIFGAMLCLGMFTPLSCLMLIGVMVGALSTTQIPRLTAASRVDWLAEFLYLPEVLYVVILVWLLLAGPGWLSLDSLLLSREDVSRGSMNNVGAQPVPMDQCRSALLEETPIGLPTAHIVRWSR